MKIFLLGVVVGAVLSMQFYLWFLAPCQQIKDYWFVTHTPARCLNV